ncbi:MAG: hypothetical protein L6Q92_06835 [Phycisphaerae bacterium]|nr:hypothetical protein [Phycisphaerae bacterium]
MFGRRSAERVKAAESALNAGRLDEAYELLRDPALRDESRASGVRSRLCEPLLMRAQERLIAERFGEALQDLDRAAWCGAAPQRVEEWRRRAVAAMQDRQRAQREVRERLNAAEQRLAEGALTLARQELAPLRDESEAAAIAERVARTAERAEALLADARSAVSRGAIDEAVRACEAVRQMYPGAEGLDAIEDSVCSAAMDDANRALADGRPDRARAVLAQLGRIGLNRPARLDLEHAQSILNDVATSFAAGRFEVAAIAAARLEQLVPGAKWLEALRSKLTQLQELSAGVRQGPIGFLLSPQNAAAVIPSIGADRGAAGVAPTPPPVIVEPGLPRRLMLRIDGAGSFLLLRGDRVTIGRAGPGATADLPLVSDLPEQAAEIVRSGEDYFVLAPSGLTVNDQPVRQALLDREAKLRIGRRVRLTFRRPSLKSPSAAIDLESGVRTVSDVRRVILMGGPVLLGPTSECHVVLPGTSIVLSERGGRMFARGLSGGGVIGAMAPVVPGQPLEIAGVRMSIQAWTGVSVAPPVG